MHAGGEAIVKTVRFAIAGGYHGRDCVGTCEAKAEAVGIVLAIGRRVRLRLRLRLKLTGRNYVLMAHSQCMYESLYPILLLSYEMHHKLEAASAPTQLL
jgi:hypothetical protein